MATPAHALMSQLPIDDKKRTTLTLPASLLDAAEQLATRRSTTISAIVAQALEAGMPALVRKDRALQTYETLRAALGDLTEEEQLLVDGIRLTPLADLPADER